MDSSILVQKCGSCRFQDGDLLSGICPQPTVGYSAFIFFSLIEYIIKSQCDISDPCRRVKELTSPNDTKAFDNTAYDFIVVGGGPGGCVMASRLSENPNHTVLLLEAGPEEPSISSVPLFAFMANQTSYDWQYETVPQKRAFLSNGGVRQWPRGKMLGGTACTSNRIYIRGAPGIFDQWGKVNKGWSYKDVDYYFKKSEANRQTVDYIEREYHGYTGPLLIENYPDLPNLASRILEGFYELGYTAGDVNGRSMEHFVPAPIMIDDGVFASPVRQYLRPVLHRKNLFVLINSLVTRVLFDKSGTRATGVQFHDKWGNLRTVKALKEVILSAGVVGSPQILMLSGVGPREVLNKVGIETVRDLPVGRNLHAHVGYYIRVNIKDPSYSNITADSLYRYVKHHDGPFSSTGTSQLTGFLRTSYAKNGIPDIQIFADYFGAKCRDAKERQKSFEFDFRPIYVVTKCRGTVTLRSSDPYDKPLIDPNYLCNEEDVDALLEMQDIIEKVVQTKALKPKIVEYNVGNEICKARYKGGSKEYWRCVIHEYTEGEHHHGGSCKMGPRSDPDAVVDNKLRVYGIKNLRVSDASVMPTPVNSNNIANVVMISEKGSDMIKSTYKKNDENARKLCN